MTSNALPRPGARTAGAALSLALALLPGLATPAGAASDVVGSAGPAVRAWTAANERPPLVTAASATRTALTHDLITALPGTYRSHLAAMRAANPRLRVFTYLNAAYAQSSQGGLYPEDWYARDASGAKIRSNGYGNYLMDVRSPGWRASRVQACAEGLRTSGYDGCMLDMLGIAPLDRAYGTGVPVDRTTGAPFTADAWLRATSDIAREVALGTGRPVVGNGAANGVRYWNPAGPTSLLQGGTDALISEIWLRTSTQSLTWFPTVTRWKASVDQLADAAARGETSLVMVKMWAPGTAAQKDRWHQFALASFLLGTDGTAMFSASYEKAGDHTAAHPWWSTPLGSPTAPYRSTGSVFTRTFTHGTVVVNPSTSTVTVPLDGTHRTLDGRLVTSVTLAGQQGAVLVRV